MHVVTFFLMPVHHRLLFGNLASIPVAFSLSYIDYNSSDNDKDNEHSDEVAVTQPQPLRAEPLGVHGIECATINIKS